MHSSETTLEHTHTKYDDDNLFELRNIENRRNCLSLLGFWAGFQP